MPKLKTHKGLAKRVKVTGRGKLKHRRPGASHLMSVKNAKRAVTSVAPPLCTRARKKR